MKSRVFPSAGSTLKLPNVAKPRFLARPWAKSQPKIVQAPVKYGLMSVWMHALAAYRHLCLATHLASRAVAAKDLNDIKDLSCFGEWKVYLGNSKENWESEIGQFRRVHRASVQNYQIQI
jgi:hypothetical protein